MDSFQQFSCGMLWIMWITWKSNVWFVQFAWFTIILHIMSPSDRGQGQIIHVGRGKRGRNGKDRWFAQCASHLPGAFAFRAAALHAHVPLPAWWKRAYTCKHVRLLFRQAGLSPQNVKNIWSDWIKGKLVIKYIGLYSNSPLFGGGRSWNSFRSV